MPLNKFDQTHRPLRENLTVREFGLVALIAEGKRNHEIAKIAGTTENVIRRYVQRMLEKSGCADKLELALRYMQEEPPEPPAEPPTAQELYEAVTANGGTGIIIFGGQ